MPAWLISQTALHAHQLLARRSPPWTQTATSTACSVPWRNPGRASQAALGSRTGIDRSDVVAALNDLAERWLADRSVDPADRRRKIITVTAAGTEQFRQLDSVVTGVQDKLLAPLSPTGHQHLIRLLNRILAHHANIQ